MSHRHRAAMENDPGPRKSQFSSVLRCSNSLEPRIWTTLYLQQ